MTTPILRHRCDICGKECETVELALACEASTPERPGLEVGRWYTRTLWPQPQRLMGLDCFDHAWYGRFPCRFNAMVGGVMQALAPVPGGINVAVGDPADWVEVPGPGDGGAT